MFWWKVSTLNKKSIEEHELWEKDDYVIRRITGFRWGAVYLKTEEDYPPVLLQLDGPSADAVNMYATDYEYDLDYLSDGWFEDFIWPDDMPEEERERLLALWEGDGWTPYETECWFYGPLEIVKNENS